MTTILIGIVTHKAHAFALPRLQQALENQTQKADILAVDTSGEDNPDLVRTGWETIRIPPGETRIDTIIAGRNLIRSETIKRGYDYLYFCDTDVIPPPGAIQKLLHYRKPLMSGIYLSMRSVEGKAIVHPCFVYPIDQTRVKLAEMGDVRENRQIEIVVGGLGCCLIHKDALKEITFRNESDSTTGGEDTAFFMDLRKKGIIGYVDTAVKCFHMRYPEGDDRNKWRDFSFHEPDRPGNK
jgi:GT2 family glycosyltransferase